MRIHAHVYKEMAKKCVPCVPCVLTNKTTEKQNN